MPVACFVCVSLMRAIILSVRFSLYQIQIVRWVLKLVDWAWWLILVLILLICARRLVGYGHRLGANRTKQATRIPDILVLSCVRLVICWLADWRLWESKTVGLFEQIVYVVLLLLVLVGLLLRHLEILNWLYLASVTWNQALLHLSGSRLGGFIWAARLAKCVLEI